MDETPLTSHSPIAYATDVLLKSGAVVFGLYGLLQYAVIGKQAYCAELGPEWQVIGST